MVKKFISLFLSFLIIFSCLSVYGNYEDQLVVKLDIQEALSVDSIADSKGASLKIYSGESTQINDLYGIYKKSQYLTVRSADDTSNTGLSIDGTGYRNLDEMSIEMWVKLNNDRSGRLFSMQLSGKSGPDYSSMDVYMIGDGRNLTMSYRPAKVSAGNNLYGNFHNANNFANVNFLANEWTHLVFTRKWSDVNADTRFGKCEYAVYVNGEKSTDANLCGIAENLYRVDESNCKFNLFCGMNESVTPFVPNNSVNSQIASFNVYKKILTTSEIAEKYEAEKFDYIEAASTMSIVSISKEEGNISYESDSIEIVFDNYIDIKTVNENISFTKADGSEIKGGSYITVSSELSKTVNIAYGKLEDGEEYTLNIADGLKSLNGISFEGCQINYRAEKQYLMYEDFMGDDYVVGEKPPVNKGIRYKSPVWNEEENKLVETTDDSSAMIVCGDDSFKYISMGGTGYVNTNSRIIVPFSPVINDDYFVAEIKIRPAAAEGVENTAARNVMTTSFVAGGTSNTLKMDDGYITVYNKSLGSGSVSFDKSTADKNGFFDVRVIYKKNSSGKYVMTLQNMNSEEESEFVIQTKGTDGVKEIEVAHIYPVDQKKADWVTSDVAKIAIYKQEKPKIIYTNAKSLSREDGELIVAFSDDIDENTLSDGSFKLKCNGKTIKTELLKYDEYKRSAYIKLNDYLNSGTIAELSINDVYTIDRVAVDAQNIVFETEKPLVSVNMLEFQDINGGAVDFLTTDSVKAVLDVTHNSDVEKYVYFALVVYDATGRITKMIMPEKEEVQNFPISVYAEEIPSGGKVKAFAWSDNDAQTGSIPIFEPITIGYGS